MTAHNDITGDSIASKPASDSYRDNFDQIFKPISCKRCGKLNPADIHTCTPSIGDGFGLCDNCDPTKCCRG